MMLNCGHRDHGQCESIGAQVVYNTLLSQHMDAWEDDGAHPSRLIRHRVLTWAAQAVFGLEYQDAWRRVAADVKERLAARQAD